MKTEELIGKRTLLVGESGTGKTRFLAKILEDLFRLLGPCKITVIDLAPEKISGIGGPVTLYTDVSGLHYLRPAKVYAPRLMACNSEDVKRYVEMNRKAVAEVFETFLRSPTEALAVNDLTIYLHSADVNQLMTFLERAKTFVATAYYGEKLSEDFGTGLSEIERKRVEKLIGLVDKVITFNSQTSFNET